MARTGTDFAALLKDKRGDERQKLILQAWKNGEVPSWITSKPWMPVTVSAVIDGVKRTLTYLVMPDGVALGTDADPYLVGLYPDYAQVVADDLYAVIPTRRMAQAMWGTATAKIPFKEPGAPWYKPGGIPGDIEATGAWTDANARYEAALATIGNKDRSQATAGGKKLLVIYRGIPVSKVAIFGGKRDLNPTSPWVQPDYGPHDSRYDPDYSHSELLVSRKGLLDGTTSVDLVAVGKDPKLHVLLNEDGPIDLHFPNTAIPWSGAAAPAGGGGGGGGAVKIPLAPHPPPPPSKSISFDALQPAGGSSTGTSVVILGILGLGMLAAKLAGH